MQITWNNLKGMSGLIKDSGSADRQKMSPLDQLQTLQMKPDLGLNYFFREKCIPLRFPCDILEKKKQMTDIHALFWVLKLLDSHWNQNNSVPFFPQQR